MKHFVLVICLLLFFLQQGEALSPRAQKVCEEIRCPVCEGQSILESEATLAQDIRRFVAEQAAAGKSEAEIRQFLVERYGEQILLTPRLRWETLALWGFPLVLCLALFGGIYCRSWSLNSTG